MRNERNLPEPTAQVTLLQKTAQTAQPLPSSSGMVLHAKHPAAQVFMSKGLEFSVEISQNLDLLILLAIFNSLCMFSSP